MTSQVPSIFDWAGGRPAFERWLGRFYDLVEHDDLLLPLFGAKVSDQHRRDVVTWWCEVMGGPATYTNDLGGYEHMLSKHRGLHITGEQRLRFVTLLSRAADDADLPDDPEFRAAVMGYAEWGTRLAVHNSSDADDIVEHAPVPRLGLGRGSAVRAVGALTRFMRGSDPHGSVALLGCRRLWPGGTSRSAPR